MSEATAQGQATRVGRPARSFQILMALLVSIALPSAIYAIYVLGQLAHIREHNLRGLERTAQKVSELLDNTRTTVGNLGRDAGFACSFFERQSRTRLLTPTCNALAEEGVLGALRFEVREGSLEIVGPLKRGELRIEVKVDALLKEVPFAAVFDRLMILDHEGKLLGSVITPQRSSPMLPPGVAATGGASPPVRVLDLSELKFVQSGKDASIKLDAFKASTLVQPVTLAGVRYTLMCQPWRIANVGKDSAPQTWRLCGFIDGERAFRQALDVAPQFIFLLLILFTLAILSWPILKVLTIAPRERIRFADMFLMLLATLSLVMVFSIAVADLGTRAQLQERSRARLQRLAAEIEAHLRAEFVLMSQELRRYDWAIAGAPKLDEATRVSCLLSPPTATPGKEGACLRVGALADRLGPPTRYRNFQNVFWMQPCTGQQFIKGTIFPQNTVAVATSGREYFEAVKHARLWSVWPAGGAERGEPPEKFFVDTAASVTTGEFFAALSIESAIQAPAAQKPTDCTAEEAKRFAAAMMGRPESFNYPILAPGIGFAVINETGRVLFHSDERRAVFENLLDEAGLSDRLRAALAARSEASFHAHYQTSPHQLHVHPLRDIPWAIVTFADDEILRTPHLETLAQTAMLIGLYLGLAVVGTLLYFLVHGREPPLWVWPRREPKYRVLYACTVWTLSAQLILSLLAVDVLRGEMLVLACLLLPVPAVLTVVVAARQARRLSARPQRLTARAHRAAVVGGMRRGMALLLALAIALLLGLLALMKHHYPVAAAQIDTGIDTAGMVLLLTVVIALGAFAGRLKVRQHSRGARQMLPLVRWWRDPLRPHIVASVIVWFVVGAVPAYGLYKFAFANEMTVMAMSEHAYLGRAFAWRACKVQEDARKLPPAELQQEPSGARASSDPTAAPLNIYLSALMSRGVALDASPAGATLVGDQRHGRDVWAYIANRAPVYNETSVYSRYFAFMAPPEQSSFQWIEAGHAGDVPASEPMLVYQHGGAGSCDHDIRHVGSRPPMREPRFGWLGGLVGLGLVPILFAWASFGARKLFFGDIEIEVHRAQGAGERSLLSHPGRLDLPPEMAWARAEVAAIFDPALHFSEETLKALCEKSTTRRAVADSILERAGSFYARQWQACTDEEKLLLIQLVQEGFANPRQFERVRTLLKRGLIRRDPVLRPMNESFALFVDQQAQPADIRELETVHQGMRWSLVRNALIAAGLLILIFLSVTQRDVVEVWVAYLGTAAAGAAGVLKLFSLLGRSGSEKAT